MTANNHERTNQRRVELISSWSRGIFGPPGHGVRNQDLDMLQYCQIKFVFIATSMKVDIVDSFEKRVKSRFSHR